MQESELTAIEECERHSEDDEDCLYHMCDTCLKAYDQFANRVLQKNKDQIAHIREQAKEIERLREILRAPRPIKDPNYTKVE